MQHNKAHVADKRREPFEEGIYLPAAVHLVDIAAALKFLLGAVSRERKVRVQIDDGCHGYYNPK